MQFNPEASHETSQEEKIPFIQHQDFSGPQTVEGSTPVATHLPINTEKIPVDLEGAGLCTITSGDHCDHQRCCSAFPPTHFPTCHPHRQFHRPAAYQGHRELDQSHNYLGASYETLNQPHFNTHNYYCTHTHTYTCAPSTSTACTSNPTNVPAATSYGPIGMTLHVTSIAIGAPFTLTRLGFSVMAQKLIKRKDASRAENAHGTEAGT